MIYNIKTNINSNTKSFSNNSNSFDEVFNLTDMNSSYKSKYESNYRLPDLNIPFSDFLNDIGESLSSFNGVISSNVNSSGLGTRDGVVAAATSLVDIFTNLGVKLPYISSTGLSGLASGKYSGIGIDSTWGTSGEWYSKDYNKYYYKSGLDCSGFISWAIHNGGYKYGDYHSSQFEYLGSKREFDSDGKPGDILWKNGHVALIVDVDNTGYTILHETENDDISKNLEGLIYTHTDFNGDDYETEKHFTHIIDMSSFYDNPLNLEK